MSWIVNPVTGAWYLSARLGFKSHAWSLWIRFFSLKWGETHLIQYGRIGFFCESPVDFPLNLYLLPAVISSALHAVSSIEGLFNHGNLSEPYLRMSVDTCIFRNLTTFSPGTNLSHLSEGPTPENSVFQLPLVVESLAQRSRVQYVVFTDNGTMTCLLPAANTLLMLSAWGCS